MTSTPRDRPPTPDVKANVVVNVASRSVPTGATRAEQRVAAEALLREGADVGAVGRLCPRCGSSDHGRPLARAEPESGPAPALPFVSISYAAGLVLVAWSWHGPVGVDVEADGDDAGVYGDLATWTRTEATLKALGAGLSQDPGTLSGAEAWTAPLDLGDGWVAAVGLVGVEQARVVVVNAG